MEDGHSKSVDEVIGFFGTDNEKGLSTDQIKRNQEKYGPNGKCIFLLLFVIALECMQELMISRVYYIKYVNKICNI